MPRKSEFKRDFDHALKIVKPAWVKGEERARLIVLARQLYQAGVIPHDIDALIAAVDEPEPPFPPGMPAFMRPRRPTANDIDWASLERVVFKYFPSERGAAFVRSFVPMPHET